ncbi:hypothetical protein KOI35_46345 [Actinoplanes bogorensis]|uniref:Ferric iron reductase FhuF-like transporter n=1 Tax=Paractinoplanes bogorensis TaxID=1610840 RepID=A0ABS5Z5H0_9ACTN|nr:hypothetical protein [Actinoplanes bogorensis]MBU2670944.1 hypothetical protein [Actinoplanes bogorensis]
MDEVIGAIGVAFGKRTLPGMAPGLFVTDPDGWIPASALAGDDIGLLLAAAGRRWPARPHVSAALMWKAYSYWLSLPVAFGWVVARRVPHVTAAQVLVKLDAPDAPVRLGLRPGTPISVLPDDPLTRGVAAADETALLATARRVLLDEHVLPLLDAFRGAVRISRRPLLGSLSAGMAHAARHAVRAVGGASPDDITTLLGTLGLTDLIEWNGGRLRRRTCCLALTLPQPRICSDCCYLPA